MAQGELMDALIPFLGRPCGPIALQDGPDAVQEALIAIFRNLGQLREPAAIMGWARAIAVREAIRVARQAVRDIPAKLPGVPVPGDPQLAADIQATRPGHGPRHRRRRDPAAAGQPRRRRGQRRRGNRNRLPHHRLGQRKPATMFALGTGIALIDLLVKDTSGDTGLPPLLGWAGMLPCLAGLLVVTLLWRRS